MYIISYLSKPLKAQEKHKEGHERPPSGKDDLKLKILGMCL